jgi:glycosyltransferase involved in cell wall biosynthesis
VFSNSAHPNVELHECAARDGIDSYLVPCNGRIDRRPIAHIRELAAQTGADVIHAHGYKADVYAYLALRASNLPLVSTCHNWLDNDPAVLLYGVADRFVLKRYARVVAVSRSVKQTLLQAGVREDNVRTIRNGIDLAPFDCVCPAVKSDAPIVGLVGRLSEEKGVDIFLRAAAQVLSDLPETKFLIAGDGPERTALESLIDGLKIRKSVSLLGQRNDMPAIYASLDVLVSASRKEGLPITLLEGMASRLAIVATPVGEVPSLIQNGQTGLLAPAEDPQSLAAAIVRLLRDPEQRRRLGAAARQLVEGEYSAQRMAADYLGVYEEAIEAAPARHRRPSSAASGEQTR